MNLFIPHCDIVLVGADTVLEDGSIISKCGTCLAAMCAKYSNIPYLVVLHTFKWTFDNKHFFRDRGSEEIKQAWPDKKNIDAANVYFERTPKEFIDTIICEKGVVNELFPCVFREEKLTSSVFDSNIN